MELAENTLRNRARLRSAIRINPDIQRPTLMPEVSGWLDEGISEHRPLWPLGAIPVDAPTFREHLIDIGLMHNINAHQIWLNRIGAMFVRPSDEPMGGELLLEVVVENWDALVGSALTHRSLESRFACNFWT